MTCSLRLRAALPSRVCCQHMTLAISSPNRRHVIRADAMADRPVRKRIGSSG